MDQLDLMLSKLLTQLKEKKYSPLERATILKAIGAKEQSKKVKVMEKAIHICSTEPKEKAIQMILDL